MWKQASGASLMTRCKSVAGNADVKVSMRLLAAESCCSVFFTPLCLSRQFVLGMRMLCACPKHTIVCSIVFSNSPTRQVLLAVHSVTAQGPQKPRSASLERRVFISAKANAPANRRRDATPLDMRAHDAAAVLVSVFSTFATKGSGAIKTSPKAAMLRARSIASRFARRPRAPICTGVRQLQAPGG